MITKQLMGGKVDGTRKTEEIMDRRGARIDGDVELVDCSRAKEDRRLWRNMTTDVPQPAGDISKTWLFIYL